MIKKLKLGLLVAVLSFAVGVGAANAANLNFSEDTNVTVNGLPLVIMAGSAADSVVVNAGTLVVGVTAPDTFTLRSVNGYTLAPSAGSATCVNNTTSSYTINTTATITFTPTSVVACSVVAGGGLSGGGGGGGSTGATGSGDVTPPTDTSVNINAGASTVNSLTVSLALNATGATEMMISNDSAFLGASWETYNASKTWTLSSGDGIKTVYAKFRDAAGNVSAAASDSITVSGSGTVVITITPPVTMTPVSAIPGCGNSTAGFSTVSGVSCVNNYTGVGVVIAGCVGTTGFSTVSGVSCVNNMSVGVSFYDFGTVTLRNGSSGAAVMELQRFLNRFLNLGLVVDGKLGPKTIAVIKSWQKSKGLVADGLVGPKTKAMMNAQAAVGY